MEYRQQHDPIAAALRAAAEAAKAEQDARNEAMWKEAQRKAAERAEVLEKWALARPEAEAAIARLRQAVAPAQVRLEALGARGRDLNKGDALLDLVTQESDYGVSRGVSLWLYTSDGVASASLAVIGWSPAEGWSAGSKSSTDLEDLLAQVMSTPSAYQAVVKAQTTSRPTLVDREGQERVIVPIMLFCLVATLASMYLMHATNSPAAAVSGLIWAVLGLISVWVAIRL